MSAHPAHDTPALDDIMIRAATGLRQRMGHGKLRRVELTRHGSIQLEWMDGGASRWFAWRNGQAEEMHVRDDRKLPLARVLRDAERARQLKVLSWRPGTRLTLLDGVGAKPRVLKGFRRGRLEGMVARYEAALEALGTNGAHAPDIVDVNESQASMQLVYHAGHRLGLSLENTDLFHKAGKALGGYQAFEPPGEFGAFDADDELNVIDKRESRLAHFGDRQPAAWLELRERLSRMRTRLPAAETGFAHRDLHDKQFILHGRQLILLDFDLACRADRTLDPANFLAHLVLRKMQGVLGATQRSIDACGERFLTGLAADETEEFWARLRYYQATSFCRLALVYRLRPPWRDLVAGLTSMGHRCLDNLRRMSAA